ncbi:PIG-L family deacetylase [Coraliomargarita sp. SDUM461004]|uniref:PIG-L family deacetylase n=1 Tax=Thalassobacterium sedimentorum TaxID=3041258 RepID=A0ABU1AHC8_9BACT|nr:PIG-L family deacetylase [Coraliomargarita sp. SDUM461004]MDQ8194175.1 PIG-L family deacetylase [Coraliomargarita sp. SDUM461004]
MLSQFVAAVPRPIEPLASGDLQLSLQKLATLGSVLYVAAHPDDENTKLIAYLANGERVDTTYLSLTRGDGGQNLIGGDLGEKLGLIRTQELLAARRVDGGQQRFSRAIDFGYSKTPEETLAIWDKNAALADTVWAIRSLRPDVIITRFSLEAGYTHGHHTASALLAKEAFTAAADPTRFPEHLEFVEPWAAKRLLWNTSKWFYQRRGIEFETKGIFSVETSGYNQLLGKAYSEIAAHSRSCHMSQGFGATPVLGESQEYFKTLAGTDPDGSLFSDIDITWGRVPNSGKVATAIQQAIADFDPLNPERVVPHLIEAHRELSALPASFWQAKKLQDLERVLAACLALDVESIATQASAVPGAVVSLKLNAIQRGSLSVSIAFAASEAGLATATSYDLVSNQLLTTSENIRIAEDAPISQPYWLRAAADKGSYTVDEISQIGDPENAPALPMYLQVTVAGESITFTIPTTYNFNDPIHGESKLPFTVTPPVMVNLEESTHILGQSEPRDFSARVIARSEIPAGTLHFEVSQGWRVEPASISFSAEAGEELLLSAQLIPPTEAGETILRASVEVDGRSYTRGYEALDYQHIPQQTLFPVAEARAVLLDVKTAGHRIGYIPGAGDTIPEALQRIGYTVDTLVEADMNHATLSDYDAIVFGIRALNTNDRVGFYMPALFEYAKQGGVVVLQYNTNRGLKTMDYAPYPFTITRDRVTDETAEMRFLAPKHPVMHFPNTITAADFDGWVQERGLYFADDWDAAYTPIFSANDAGESPLDGGLLIAQTGEGYFVYSGLSWFRQFPAGVPGAYRLFANLMSLGQVSE